MVRSYTFWASLTWLVTSLFYGFQFFLRSSPSPIANQLMSDFHIDAAMLGLLSSAYYIPYALLQIPIGIALDIWGPKRILRYGALVCVLGGLLFSMSDNIYMAMGGRCLIGMGAAASFIGSIRINTLWVPPAYLAFTIGLLSSVGKLGGASASAFLPALMKVTSSWHSLIYLLCLWGGFLTLMIWVFVRNGSKDDFTSVIQVISLGNIYKELSKVLHKPIVWFMGIYGYSLYVTLSVFSDTYAINFLCQRLGVGREVVNSLASCVFIGSALGAPILSYLSDFFQRRLFFLRLSAFGTLAMSTIIFYGPSFSKETMTFFMLAFGFFSGGQILIFVISTESVAPSLAGMATGVTNALLMTGGALHNPLVGWLLGLSWDGKKQGGYPIYTLWNYQMAFLSLTVCFIVAFVISFIVNESYPHHRKTAKLNIA